MMKRALTEGKIRNAIKQKALTEGKMLHGIKIKNNLKPIGPPPAPTVLKHK